jgi:hypothetical protein
MKLINETFLINTFDEVLKSGDLQKLVNVKKSESNELEEHLISMSITSEQQKMIQSLNIDEKTEEYLSFELKDYFFKKITDFIYSTKKTIQNDELDYNNIDNQIVIGSSGAIIDIPENISTILDHNKSFSDNSLAITNSIDLILDYNSIRIQTIGMEGFAPKMNCKFSFCLFDSE